MSANPIQLAKWSDVLDYKARILYAQIGLLQREVREQGGNDEMIDTLCAPYVQLLKSMYAEDYPLAKAIEESDLLVRLDGPAINRDNPRVSVITGVFGKVRTQVANVAKAIAQLSESKKRIPKEMDLGLSAFAKGSLILGFTLPSPEEISAGQSPQQSLFGESDEYLFQAARQAIRTIGVVSRHVTEGGSIEELSEIVPDAKVRDTALFAVENLAPSKRQGIDTVSIGGRELAAAEIELKPLTVGIREEIHKQLQHPVVSDESVTFVGEVREIDLDARRFDLRHIENEERNTVRCSYIDESDEEATAWLNRRVQVEGTVERDSEGRARLLDIASIRVLE